MALVIDATLAGENANSWVTIAYADEYFENHVSLVKRDGWAALSDDQKTLALITAAVLLDSLKITNDSTVTTSTADRTNNGEVDVAEQALQLPRNIDKKSDDTYFIPEQAMMAQCEQAYYSSQFDETTLATQRQGLFRDALEADGVRIAQGFSGQGDAYSPTALHLFRKFLIGVRSKRIRRS